MIHMLCVWYRRWACQWLQRSHSHLVCMPDLLRNVRLTLRSPVEKGKVKVFNRLIGGTESAHSYQAFGSTKPWEFYYTPRTESRPSTSAEKVLGAIEDDTAWSSQYTVQCSATGCNTTIEVAFKHLDYYRVDDTLKQGYLHLENHPEYPRHKSRYANSQKKVQLGYVKAGISKEAWESGKLNNAAEDEYVTRFVGFHFPKAH